MDIIKKCLPIWSVITGMYIIALVIDKIIRDTGYKSSFLMNMVAGIAILLIMIGTIVLDNRSDRR